MKLDPKQKIAGIPILKVRRALTRGCGRWFNDHFLARQLEVSEADAVTARKALLEVGFIEPASQEKGCSQVAPKGARLCNTIGLRRITRKKAEQHVQALIERANKVNADPHFLYRVKQIRVFGSYTTSAPDLGDIDLVLVLERKEPDADKHHALESQRIRDAMEAGRSFKNMVDEVFWPQTEVKRFLKQRCAYLRLHDHDDPIGKAEAKEVLFDGG